MRTLWSQDNGLTDVTSAFKGFTQPLSEIVDDIHRRGWTVGKIHVKDGDYVAEGKSPHGDKLEATGRTDTTAAGNLLVKIMRREHMRSSAVKEKLGAWDHYPIEQQLNAIAQAYAGAPVYEPKAATAWMDLAQDCSRRAQIIRMQLAIEYTNDPIPYESANDMREDVTKKRKILVTRAYAHHPVFSEQQMLDYRLVVDVLGHAIGGGDWGWHGTCLAFASLAPMLAESPQKALFTELLGQSAFGTFYRQWGPQKICFLDELVEKEQKRENKPGHTGVHPSQAIVPVTLPHISAVVGTPPDPNADWESGIQPLPDNAYLWQRENGVDPLDSQSVMENLRAVEPGLTRMHPEMGKQAVVNALRASLLGSRTNQLGHAVHYQDLMHIPANVDDPMAYHDALEQQREHWNQGQGYAPGSHKQHWPEEQQFKQWVKAANPHLDDGDVNRAAKREMLHMLMEEEERILAQDQGEQLPAEVVEHEAYEALKQRLKALTKSNVDQKVDFGDTHLWHEAADHQVMYHMSPAANRESIQRQGLLPNSADYTRDDPEFPDGGVDPGVYMFDNAGAFHPQTGIWPGNEHQDIWQVNTAGLLLDRDDAAGMTGSWYSPDAIPAHRLQLHSPEGAGQARTATYHADMYPPYIASSLRPMAQVSRHANALAEAAKEDLQSHRGHGHHFRSTALSLGIPGLGPRQASHAWLHLAPQTSQLGIIEPQLMEALGHDYTNDMSNRNYFKHERELTAARDASGYSHVPLGAFTTGVYDLKAGGPGWHPDRTPFKAHSPAPHHTIDWPSQEPTYPAWPDPYWWQSTQQARDQVAQDFDRTVGTQFSRDEIPFQKTAAASGRSPWVVHPGTGERLTGAPGTSLMQHLKDSLGHPDVHSVWAQDYEVGKSS